MAWQSRAVRQRAFSHSTCTPARAARIANSRIVELHGGRIGARSAGLGAGSEFIVRLPIVPATMDAPPPMADAPGVKQKMMYKELSQYEHGLTSFIQVLDAERTVLSDRQALVQADVQIVNDIVMLYRALGGGWEATG